MSGNASITILPLPTANAGADQTVCKGDQVTLSGSSLASQDDAYGWDNGVTNATAFTAINATNLPIATTYTLTVTGQGGCPSIDQMKVKILRTPIIPNTFSPMS